MSLPMMEGLDAVIYIVYIDFYFKSLNSKVLKPLSSLSTLRILYFPSLLFPKSFPLLIWLLNGALPFSSFGRSLTFLA